MMSWLAGFCTLIMIFGIVPLFIDTRVPQKSSPSDHCGFSWGSKIGVLPSRKRWGLHSTLNLHGATFEHTDSLICCSHVMFTYLPYTHCFNKGLCFIFPQMRKSHFHCLRKFFFVPWLFLVLQTIQQKAFNDIKTYNRTLLLASL